VLREDGALERVGHHATGDRTGRELLSMRILDAAIHGWDLARAIGADEGLDEDVVAFLLAYVTRPVWISALSNVRPHRRMPMVRATRHRKIGCSTGWAVTWWCDEVGADTR